MKLIHRRAQCQLLHCLNLQYDKFSDFCITFINMNIMIFENIQFINPKLGELGENPGLMGGD